MNPLLLLVQADGPKVFRLNAGHTDDGRPVVLRAVPAEYAPGGAGSECVFHRLHLVVSHTFAAPVPVRVIPILDGVRLDEGAVLLALVPAVGGISVSQPFKVELSRALKGFAGTTIGRVGLRGTWFTFLVDTPEGLAPGTLELESAELEYEITREGKEAS